jgi:hypothetical protein
MSPHTARASCRQKLLGTSLYWVMGHTFDFDNYSYAVQARLYRGTVSLLPQIYRVRLQALSLTTAQAWETGSDSR